MRNSIDILFILLKFVVECLNFNLEYIDLILKLASNLFNLNKK